MKFRRNGETIIFDELLEARAYWRVYDRVMDRITQHTKSTASRKEAQP